MTDPAKTDSVTPTTETRDARRPSETLDKGQSQGETIPRKSSLLGND
jgi:hypothetical protein